VGSAEPRWAWSFIQKSERKGSCLTYGRAEINMNCLMIRFTRFVFQFRRYRFYGIGGDGGWIGLELITQG